MTNAYLELDDFWCDESEEEEDEKKEEEEEIHKEKSKKREKEDRLLATEKSVVYEKKDDIDNNEKRVVGTNHEKRKKNASNFISSNKKSKKANENANSPHGSLSRFLVVREIMVHGTIKFRNGLYTGKYKNGVPNGEGQYNEQGGACYTGTWINGKMCGFGKYYETNGTVKLRGGEERGSVSYVGYWINDKYSGKGILNFYKPSTNEDDERGFEYIGMFHEGLRHGRGKQVYHNKTVHCFKAASIFYSGRWKEDKKNGHGIMYHKNGTISMGEWMDDYIWKGVCNVLDDTNMIEFDEENSIGFIVLDPFVMRRMKNTIVKPGCVWIKENYLEGKVHKTKVCAPKKSVTKKIEIDSKQQQQQQKKGGYIQPIQTFFNGCHYRSRLEAKWAFFFECLKFTAFYEPYTLVRKDGTKYTPDFALITYDSDAKYPPKIPMACMQEIDIVPIACEGEEEEAELEGEEEIRHWGYNPHKTGAIHCLQLMSDMIWIEIKPTYPTMEERSKMHDLVVTTKKMGYILYGGNVEEPFVDKFRSGVKGIAFFPTTPSKELEPVAFAECPLCKKIELTYLGQERLIQCSCQNKKDEVEKISRYFSRLQGAYELATTIKFE